MFAVLPLPLIWKALPVLPESTPVPKLMLPVTLVRVTLVVALLLDETVPKVALRAPVERKRA